MQIRQATSDDVTQICALVRGLSDPFFLSPSGQGAELFLKSIDAPAIQGYVSAANFSYCVAQSEGRLVGVVAVRDTSHLYHLFVAADRQGQGLGRALWQHAKSKAVRLGNPGRFTVNSSLGAVPVYLRLGFAPSGPAVVKHGISYQPMLLVESESEGQIGREGEGEGAGDGAGEGGSDF